MKKKFIKTPLVGVQVHGAKDVGTRTVNLLMGEHAGEYVRGDIMDANAVIQAFDELKGNVDNNHDSLEEIVDEIHNFRDTTNHRFQVFQEKAEEETANRIQGDNTLDQKIDQKERESNERDNVLQQNIDTEKQERINADTQLRNDLTAELNKQVGTLNAAIDTKQPKGNYLTEHQSLEEYAKKVELPTVPTKVSQLTNDSEFITKSVYDEKIAALEARIAALEAKHPETAS